MPAARSHVRIDEGHWTGIPSFKTVFASRTWVKDALCAREPYSKWKAWLLEPTSGREHPGTMAKALAVCLECPVRRECLTDSFEAGFSTVGVWGGAAQSERRHLMPRGGLMDDAGYAFKHARERREAALEAIEFLYDSLPARLNGWRTLASRYQVEREAARVSAAD